MKLVISKNKDGNGYYSKIQNDYNGKHTEKYLAIQVPKDIELEYGLYEVDGFLSTYEKKDGSVEFKLVLTSVNKIEKEELKEEKNPFEDMKTKVEADQSIEITDEDLPF